MSSNSTESLERWLRPLPFGAFLALAIFACFPQVLLGLESFFARDYGVLGYPTIVFQREAFWRGELPMWNPYSNLGQPFLAQWGPMALYPFSLIYLLLPLPWSLGLFCLAHVWLGGIGMHLLARRWTESNVAGALAGTFYVFNGITFASFAWSNYLVTLGWMPLVVLLAERAWREGGRWIIGAALVGALQMLSGAPEVILFTWFIVGVLCLCDALRAGGSLIPFFGRILAIVLLTAGLTAVQLIPFFELITESHRDPSFATSKWRLPLWGWANFLVPLYNAFEVPSGQYFQHEQQFLTSVYLGGTALTFALLGIFRWPDARVWALTLVALFSVLLAFGEHTPVYSTLRKLFPLVGIARYPVKFLFIVAFIIPLLAGCGMAAIVKSRLPRGLLLSLALVLTTMGVIAWAAHGHRFVDYSDWPQDVRGNSYFSWARTEPGEWLPDGILNVALRMIFCAASVFLLAAAVRARRSSLAFAFLGMALIAADVRTHTPRQNPTLPSAAMTRRYWPAELPSPELGQDRVFIRPRADAYLTYLSGTNATTVWETRRRAQWSNLNLLDRVSKVNGSSTLQTREERLVETAIYSMTNRPPQPLLDFLGAKWTTSTNAADEWLPRPTALPLVTAGQRPVFLEEAAALEAMVQDDFEPQRVVFLSPGLRSQVVATSAVPAVATNVVFTTQSIEADIITPEPTVAVIAQSFYPAWNATVDGESVPLLLANVAFQAVSIPAGQHRLRITYSDFYLRAGAGVSAASLLVCVVLWLRFGRTRRGGSQGV